MTTLRRLLLCLFSLALLPGAQARVAMPVAASLATMADAAGTQPDGCHDAPVVEPAIQHGAQHHGTGTGTGTGTDHDAAPAGSIDPMASMECCPGHDSDAPACGDACTCPPLMLTALAPPAADAAPAVLHAHAWQRHGHATRTGPADGPPRRPPIG